MRLEAELKAAQTQQSQLLNPNGSGYMATGFQQGIGMVPMQQMMPMMQPMMM